MTDPEDTRSESQRHADHLVDLANAEKRERRGRAPVRAGLIRERVVLISLAVGAPILVVLLMVTFAGPFVDAWFETRPPAAVARMAAQQALDALVADIESFRHDYNELPQTLVEIGVPERGRWNYVVVGPRHYRVGGSLYGQAVNFDSATRAAVQ